jgi:hypothetical protein
VVGVTGAPVLCTNAGHGERDRAIRRRLEFYM